MRSFIVCVHHKTKGSNYEVEVELCQQGLNVSMAFDCLGTGNFMPRGQCKQEPSL